MWSSELQLENKAKIQLATNHISIEEDSETISSDVIGGFLGTGKYCWKAYESNLEVFCTRSGVKIAFHDFNDNARNKNCTISCVKEIIDPEYKTCLALIAVNIGSCTSMIYTFMIKGSKVIGKIEVNEDITCLEYIDSLTCNRGILNQYKGCASVGTQSGKIFLIDLCLAYLDEDDALGRKLCMNGIETTICHVEFANMEPSKIAASHKILQEEGVYFGLQLESIDAENQCSIRSLLEISPSIALAAGLDDGRMILYDLTDLKVFHLSMPPVFNTPLVQSTFIEPADDPKACIYIWTFHAGSEGAYAVMHSIMYEDKFLEGNYHVYENFISCSTRLTMSCHDRKSIPVSCQSIRKIANQEDEMLTLCLLSWTTSHNSINTLLFDLNQWYKEEMPSTCDWRAQPNHIVIFPIKTNELIFSVYLKTESLMPFNSIQRPEEHFYPNSLTFGLKILGERTCNYYHWVGLQNKALEFFEYNGPIGILDPGQCYSTLLNAALIPQFYEHVFNRKSSIAMQREFLLSIALEYNFYNLLKGCAIKWADGSQLSCQPENGLSLSSLTDWIWNRAKVLKETSNKLCIPLFDHSGRRIDCGTQKILWHCSNQLKFLTELYEMILNKCRQYIPENVIKSLRGQYESIKMASEYQEVLQWLLNVGLLPEGSENQSIQSNEFVLVPFPHEKISTFYKSRRMKLYNEYEDQRDRTIPIEEQSCQHLYVDVFIEREFQNDALNKVWTENKGIYPPTSMQNVLRTLLLPNVSIENKYILLIYVFLDIHESIKDERYTGIVQNLIKFPAVFKINPTIIKRTQALWFLDRGNIDVAVKELISPFSHDQTLLQWQREFLISTLLRQDASHLALRVLRAPGLPISSFLEMKTLLINNLVSEAFKLQKTKRDPELLRYFFKIILKLNRQEMLLELSLSEEEGAILREYLNTTKFSQAENLHIVYLLQRAHFIDAIHMVDSLAKKKNASQYNLDAPRDVLTAYHTTLDPTTKHLSQMAYTDKKPISHRQKPEIIDTLSTILIKKKNTIRNGLFNESINCIREASDKIDHQQPFLERPGLGIFGLRTQVQCNDICYPIVVHKKDSKRQLNQDDSNNRIRENDIFSHYEQPAKRRKVDSDTVTQKKSYFEMPKSVLTRFADVRPSFNFTANKNVSNFFKIREKSTSKSPIAELITPIIEKIRTDEENYSEDRQTPQSILKVASSVTSLNKSTSSQPFISKSLDVEEKTIRFELPKILKSPIVEKPRTPTLLNTSIMSNDEFYSPEVSMEEQSFTQNSNNDVKEFMAHMTGGPKARKPLRSRSNTPVENQNEIAIIIDDIEDSQASNTMPVVEYIDEGNIQHPSSTLSIGEIVSPNVEETLNDSKTGKILRRIDGPTPRKSLSRYVLEKNAVFAMDEDQTPKDTLDSVQVSEEVVQTYEEQPYETVLPGASFSNEIIEYEPDIIEVDESFESQEPEGALDGYEGNIVETESNQGIELGEDEEHNGEDDYVVEEEEEHNEEEGEEGDVVDEEEHNVEEGEDDDVVEEEEEEEDEDSDEELNDHDVISISSSSEDSIHKEARKLEAEEELVIESEMEEDYNVESESRNVLGEGSAEIGSNNSDPMIVFHSEGNTAESAEIKQSLVYEESDDSEKLMVKKQENYYSGNERKSPEILIVETVALAGCSHIVHPMDFVVSQVQENTVNLGVLVESQSSAALENIEQDHLTILDDSQTNCQNLLSTEPGIFVGEDQKNVKIYEEMVSHSHSILQENTEKQEETPENSENNDDISDKSNEKEDVDGYQSKTTKFDEQENVEVENEELHIPLVGAEEIVNLEEEQIEEDCQIIVETDNVNISEEKNSEEEEVQENKPSSTTDGADTSDILDVTPIFEDAQESLVEVSINKSPVAENLSVEQNEVEEAGSPKKLALSIPSTSGQHHGPIVAIEEAKDLSMSQSNSENESKSPVKIHDEVSNYENERELKRSLSTPKNAHEQIAPVMNLSVKPDEAHVSDRINKIEEAQSSPALNLSFENTDSGEKESDFTLQVEDDEQVTAPGTPGTRTKRSVSVPKDLELPKTPTRRSRRLSVGDPSTPQGALKSKLIQALEKIEENSDELHTPRRTRKMSSTDEPTTPRTPLTRSRRTSIAELLGSVDTPSRQTRATSVVQGTPSTPNTRKRKISESDNLDSGSGKSAEISQTIGTPKKRRASSLAKELDVRPTTSRRTRATSIPNDKLETPKKSSALPIVEEAEETSTPRKTRASSVLNTKEAEGKDLKPLTPRRTRAISVTVHEQKSDIPEKSLTALSSHDGTTDEVENVEILTLSKQQTLHPSAKESISDEPEKSSSEDTLQEYTSARRLTRAQSAVIKKSIQIDKNVRKTKSHPVNVKHDNDESELSESESIVSNLSGASKQSKRSSARLKRKTKTDALETQSNASVDTDMSTSPAKKPNTLDTIEEELPSSSKEKPKRGRPKRK